MNTLRLERWQKVWLTRMPWAIHSVPGSSMIELHGVRGFLTPNDLGFLFSLASELPAGGTYLEVGSWQGLSGIVVANGLLANLNLNAQIFCVDTWEGSQEHQEMSIVREDLLFEVFQKNVIEAQMDCFIKAIRGRSVDVAASWNGPDLDLIFIDGDHSAEGCYEDIQAWFPRLAKEGRMLGHDAKPNGSVVAGLERFRAETGNTYQIHNMPQSHYIWELNLN